MFDHAFSNTPKQADLLSLLAGAASAFLLAASLMNPTCASAAEDGVSFACRSLDDGVRIMEVDIDADYTGDALVIPETIDGRDVVEFDTTGFGMGSSESPIKTIDFSQAKKLRKIEAVLYYDSLSNVVFDGNGALTYLNIETGDDMRLGTLDLRGCPNLAELYLFDCSFKGVNLASNPKLRELNVRMPRMTSLDLRGCPNLREVSCISCSKLAEISLSKCTKLVDLNCSDTKIKSLNLAKCKRLEVLNVSITPLKTLNVSNNKELWDLDCSDTKISKLNLSKNKMLESILCYGAPIKTLDLRKNKRMWSVGCSKSTTVLGFNSPSKY